MSEAALSGRHVEFGHTYEQMLLLLVIGEIR